MINAKGRYGSRTDDFFKDSLIANQVRGTDSAGLFQVNFEGGIAWKKMGACASDFVRNQDAKILINRVPTTALTVGHVRSATVGDAVVENAHPFSVTREDGTHVIGVHNGTLTSWRDKKGAHKFKVDSHWMIHMLAHEGADAFEHFNGAFAVVWYDSAQPGYVYMARNKDRPLCYMVNEDGTTMAGCSELGMLGWLTSRNSIRLAKEGKWSTHFYLEEGKIYKFDLNNIGNYEVTNYPKYDPETSLTRPYSGGSGSFWRPQGHPSHTTDIVPWNPKLRDGWDDEHLDDWYGTSSASSDYTWNLADQENTLAAVKAELREVRYNLIGRDKEDPEESGPLEGEYRVVDEDALDRAQHNTITRSLFKSKPSLEESLLNGDYTYLTVKTKDASANEIEAAKAMGLFGRVVTFLGVEYDNSINSLLGYFNVKEENGNVTAYDGILRFIQEKTARDMYLDTNVGSMAIVIGYRGEEDMLVLTMPKPEESKFIYSLYENQGQRAEARSN